MNEHPLTTELLRALQRTEPQEGSVIAVSPHHIGINGSWDLDALEAALAATDGGRRLLPQRRRTWREQLALDAAQDAVNSGGIASPIPTIDSELEAACDAYELINPHVSPYAMAAALAAVKSQQETPPAVYRSPSETLLGNRPTSHKLRDFAALMLSWVGMRIGTDAFLEWHVNTLRSVLDEETRA